MDKMLTCHGLRFTLTRMCKQGDQNPIAALLSLFHHNANTAARMKHCLTVAQATVYKLNPGQHPAPSGVAVFYCCSHVKQTRHTRSVSAAALYILMQHQYESYCNQCICRKANLQCTALCHCDGEWRR